MDKKVKITIIVSIISLALVLIGVTYAYFSAIITGVESASTITLTGGRMVIHYSEGDENVSANDIYPREEAWITKTITLTGWNSTDTKMNYYLGLNVINNTFPMDYLTYDLTLLSGNNGSPISTKTNVSINSTGKIILGNGYFEQADGETHNYELKIYFKENGKDQNDGKEAIFNAKIYIEESLGAPKGWGAPEDGSILAAIKNNNSEPTEMLTVPGKELSAAGFDVKYTLPKNYFSNGTIIYANTRDDLINNVNTSSGTYAEIYQNMVGKYIKEPFGEFYDYIVSATSSSADVIDVTVADFHNEYETSFLSTEDDYGTSYYYRGIINNNYIVFANMCWRIVRIDGLGNLKITLHNYNPTNATNPCDASLDGDEKAFARVGTDTSATKVAFNTKYDKKGYAGFMYSNTPDSDNYYEQFANDKDSTILAKLKIWYDQVFSSSDKEKLADVIWCNDKRIVKGASTEEFVYYDVLNDNLSSVNEDLFSLYQPYKRLIPVQEASPSLMCGSGINDNKLSKYTAYDTIYGNGALNGYKIGLLTSDEVAFAGSTASAMASASYLGANTNLDYLTLSPSAYYYSSTNDRNNYVTGIGSIYSTGAITCSEIDRSIAIRPTVSLLPSIQVTGSGTQADPFVVN